MSSFGGLHIASSGLFASQKALEIISKNIANANTVGYSRQQVLLNPTSHDMGVDIAGIQQIREDYLDSQFRSEQCRMGEWEAKTDALGMMEEFLKEPSEQGLNHAIGVFFNALQDVSMTPEALEMRAQLLQSAITLTDTFHYVHDKLTELQENQNNQIKSSVDELNKFADEIAMYNKEIRDYELIGDKKENDLRDLRNNVLDKMSKYTDIKSSENLDGTITLMIGDEYLVEFDTVNYLEVVADTENNILGEPLLYSVHWQGSGNQAEMSGGKIKGFIDIRDGNGISAADEPKFFGVPYFLNEVNLLAKTMVRTINDIHQNGYTLPNDSNGYISETGINFFEPADAENQADAKNISVSEQIIESVFNIATSDEYVSDINQGNNVIIKQISDLRDRKDLAITIGGETHSIGGFEDYMKQIASELAVVSSNSIKRYEAQLKITQNVDNKRLSVSGVSIDEEMTNMIKFQNAYTAAARVITSINTMLEQLLNMAR